MGNNMSWVTRLVGICCIAGAVWGIMFDIDHPIALLLGIKDGRFLHNPFFAGSVILFLLGIKRYVSLLRRFI